MRLGPPVSALFVLLAGLPAGAQPAEGTVGGAPSPPQSVAALPDDGWTATSLCAWGLTDAMREQSDQALLGGTLFARRDRVLTDARVVIELADRSSVALAPEVTGLDLRFGEEVIARFDREDLVAGPRLRVLPLEPHALGDENPFLLSFRTEAASACQPGVPRGTWRLLRVARIDLRSETLPLPNDLELLPLPFYDARTDRAPTVHLAFSRPPEAAELRAAAFVAAYFGRLAGERPVRFVVHVGELPAEHAVVLTTTGALPDGTAVPGDGDPVLAWMDHPRSDEGPHELLVVSGRDAGALEQAARRLADAAWGAPLPEGPLARVGGPAESRPAGRDERSRTLVTRRAVRLGDLVGEPAALVHRGHRRGTIAVPFRIAPALMAPPPDSVVFDLVYAQHTPLAVPPPRVDVELNGVFVETLPTGPGGPQSDPVRRRVRLPRERLRGTNWLRLHVNAVEDEALCGPDSEVLLETVVSGDSVLRLDGRAPIERLPDIDAFVHDGLPFTRDPALAETTIVLPRTPHPAEIATALAIVASLVDRTGRPPTGLRFADEASLLDGGRSERDLLVVAAVGAALLDRWSDRLPLSTSGGVLHAREPTPLDTLRDVLRARWPGAEAQRAAGSLATLAHPVALMGCESPLAPGRSVVVVTAPTPAELPPTLDPAAFLAPRFPAGADLLLLLADGPETVAFRIGATYPRAGVDGLAWALWVVSEHWVALVPALLVAALFLALLARRRLRRIEAARLAGALLLAAIVPFAPAARGADRDGGGGGPCGSRPWPEWEAYQRHFLSEDGRIIDRSDGDRTTSEGQAYALFFALVADDRPAFDRLLRWTQDNLAQGDLGRHLPAWKWGRDAAGGWRVLDPNPASDADLWLVYGLIEAARLWAEPRYAVLAERLAARIAAAEVRDLPGLGPMVLPGPEGFVLEGERWRLNPSYLPLFLLRRLHGAGVSGPWQGVARSAVTLVQRATEGGFVPDWVVWDAAAGVTVDADSKGVGSYDAIRNYLWAGLLSDDDEHKATLSVRLDGMFRHWQKARILPERVVAGAPEPGTAAAPPGFYGALLPTVAERGGPAEVARLRAVLAAARRDDLWGSPPAYYDQNLILFGDGFASGRYRFLADGRLAPEWARRCGRP